MTAKEVLDYLEKLQNDGHNLSEIEVLIHRDWYCQCSNYEDNSYAEDMELTREGLTFN